MSSKNPIKFLDAYTREDKDIFFGREKDTNLLYEKVNQSGVVLLYGLSGTGKTSLIHCGLENRFEEGQRLFIYIRRGRNITHSINQALNYYAASLMHPNSSVKEKLEVLYFDYLKPITLIFDQFEELFISGSYDEKEELISALEEVIKSDLKVKIIFSLREEYLAHMDEFEEKIPNIYDHRLRLEKMRRGTVEEVITKISEKAKVELESDEVPGMIIDNISDRKGNVELPYLQVYLDKLTRLSDQQSKKLVFSTELVNKAGELEDVLGDFLDEQINRIAGLIGNKESINHILKQLITPDGTKRQLTIAQFKGYGNASQQDLKNLLSELELSRLIKLEDGIYELSHDSLAQKIAEKRSAEEIQIIEVIKFIRNAYNSYRQTETLLDRKQLKYVEPYLKKIDLSVNERNLLKASYRKERNRKVVFWSAIAIGVIFILAAGFYWQYDRYQSIVSKAEEELQSANYLEARTYYLRALDVYIPNTQRARKGLVLCDSMLKLEPEFNRLITEGNGFFNLGINHYDLAFERYFAAEKLNFNNEAAEGIINDKKEDAIKRYVELAKIEDDEGHTDIAFSHLAKAYKLDKGEIEIVNLFDDIVSTSSQSNLVNASISVKNDNSAVVSSLLSLVNKSQENQPNNSKYELIRNTLGQ